MTIVVYIVLLLSILAVFAKVSLLGRLWRFLYASLLALFVWGVQSYAVESRSDDVTSFVSDLGARQGVAILATLEFIMLLLYAFRSSIIEFSSRSYRGWARRWEELFLKILSRYYISLLIFPVLFFLLSQSIYAFPGVGFEQITLTVAIATFVLLLFGAFLFEWMLPEKEHRREMYLLLSLFLSFFSLIAASKETLLFAPSSSRPVFTLVEVIVGGGGFLLFFTLGYLLHLYKPFRYK